MQCRAPQPLLLRLYCPQLAVCWAAVGETSYAALQYSSPPLLLLLSSSSPPPQEALGLMAPAFKQVEPGNRKFIEAIVATYIEKDEYQVGELKKIKINLKI